MSKWMVNINNEWEKGLTIIELVSYNHGKLGDTWVLSTIYDHLIIVEIYGWTKKIQPSMWDPRGLPLGEIGAGRLVHMFKVFTFKKEAWLIVGLLILIVPISRLHIDVHQLNMHPFAWLFNKRKQEIRWQIQFPYGSYIF